MWHVDDLAINLLASIVFVLGVSALSKLYVISKTRAERRIWRPLRANKLPVAIVLTTRKGPLQRSTHRTSLNEVSVLVQFIPLFLKLHLSYYILDPLKSTDHELAGSNLLVFGGPAVNGVSKKAMDIMQPRLPIRLDLNAIAVTIADRRYEPLYDEASGVVKKDYGLLLRTKNPFDTSGRAYIIGVMGCHGFGTGGVAEMLTRSNMASYLSRSANNNEFVAIIEVSVLGEGYECSIVEMYSLHS